MVAKVLFLALALFCAALAAPEAPASRIVGGNPVTIKEFPYAASLVYFYTGPALYLQRCVGGIISSYHVLTTAFCFTGADLQFMSVQAGSSNSLSGGLSVPVSDVVQYPDYQANPRQNDIAVAFLSVPLPISDTINALYLPPPGFYIPDETIFRVVSWGFASEDGPQHQNLQSIYLHNTNINDCKEIYTDVANVTIDSSVLCAAQYGNIGTCFGDSGAPMAINNVVVGVASVYHECGTDIYPDVFTRVDRFTEWIMDVAKPPEVTGATDENLVPVRVASY